MVKITNKQMIIVGQRRSGTSMLSGILYYLGITVGATSTQKSSRNIKGFFEDREIIMISEKMISTMNISWLNPNKYLENKSEYDNKLINRFGDEIIQYIEKRNQQYMTWGFKDVNHILFWHLYIDFLMNPYYIVIRRKINAIASSLANWHDGADKNYFNITKIYSDEIDTFCKNKHDHILELFYDEILSNPILTVDNIIKFCQIQPTEKQKSNAIKHITPSLKHY